MLTITRNMVRRLGECKELTPLQDLQLRFAVNKVRREQERLEAQTKKVLVLQMVINYIQSKMRKI